jgi:hypothetical protein
MLRWFVVVTCGAAFACTSFGSDPTPAADGGTLPTPAADGNLLANGDFENTGDTCAGWVGTRLTLSRSTTAHQGSASCRLCEFDPTIGTPDPGSAADIDVYLDPQQFGIVNPPLGERYGASLAIRVESGALASVELSLAGPGPGGPPPQSRTGSVTASDWGVISTEIVVGAGMNPLTFGFHAKVSAGACFLVDDISVKALP